MLRPKSGQPPPASPSSLRSSCALGQECHPHPQGGATHPFSGPRQFWVPLSRPNAEASSPGLQGLLEAPPCTSQPGPCVSVYLTRGPPHPAPPGLPVALQTKSRLFPLAPANLPRQSPTCPPHIRLPQGGGDQKHTEQNQPGGGDASGRGRGATPGGASHTTSGQGLHNTKRSFQQQSQGRLHILLPGHSPSYLFSNQTHLKANKGGLRKSPAAGDPWHPHQQVPPGSRKTRTVVTVILLLTGISQISYKASCPRIRTHRTNFVFGGGLKKQSNLRKQAPHPGRWPRDVGNRTRRGRNESVSWCEHTSVSQG
ncbi:uncharacterized protein [Equus przewalskii]|uniref:Uncharacterized protein n=1 Tax=Equus przewalskii TaxID=9798 RepID=A0ABM4JI39_EQUPR